MTWKEKRQQLIQRLPTLLDVLENISLKEESFLLNPGRFKGLFPTHHEEGMFFSVKDPSGINYLLPIGILPFTYFRGESSYHPICKPSLYRPFMTPSKVFLERLRACELELVINDHPMTQIFRNGTMILYPDGSTRPVQFSVDALALAQHYGIYTELLDLTVNKWVAAFFACTKCKNDVYEPIKENEGYGVIYVYGIESQLKDMVSSNGFSEMKLRPVGLQPFSRPGEQGGYVLKLAKDDNFNHLCTQKIKFRHDSKIAELVFNYANRSKKLFPYDPLQDKAKVIRNSTTFSQEAYSMTVNRYFPTTQETDIESWINEEKINIQNDPIVKFSDKEKQDFYKKWQREERSYYDRIII